MSAYRCSACGNKTRFDVIETKRVQAFHHFNLAGELTIEEEEVLEHEVESVTCRWCGSKDVEEASGPAESGPQGGPG
jgi:DNA-directed RNA polymerase subunit RPC12/RpoP